MVHKNSGSALIYILVAIALIALLTVSMMEPSNQQGQAQNQSNLIAEMQSQISLISSAIDECVLTYPNQDAGLTSTQQPNPPYPIRPNDTYFSTSTPGVAASSLVSFIRCPGNPGGSSSTSKNHALIFGGTSGKFLPPPPNLLGGWAYYTGNDGIFILTGTSMTDSYIKSTFMKLDEKYSPDQADCIDATSGAVSLASDLSGWQCPANNRCFRYWIIRRPTAIPANSNCTL